MSTDPQTGPRRLPDRPNLRHSKDQAKDLLKSGGATSIADAQFKTARLYGFASWAKLKALVESLSPIETSSDDFILVPHQRMKRVGDAEST